MHNKSLILGLIVLGAVSASPTPKDTFQVEEIAQIAAREDKIEARYEEKDCTKGGCNTGGFHEGTKRDIDDVVQIAAREDKIEARYEEKDCTKGGCDTGGFHEGTKRDIDDWSRHEERL